VRAAAALERGERPGLFAACSRKSYEQVEELLAVRFPRPDVRDLIRRLPEPRVGTPDMGSKQTEPQPVEFEARAPRTDAWPALPLPLVPQLQGERPRPPAHRGAVKPLSAERFSVNFTADAAFS
jgi:hypothetical protein